jgi:hypothetical protein
MSPLAASSSTAKQAAQRAAAKQTAVEMPDSNKGVGWRKKIQNKPKDLQPLKPSTDDASSTGRHYFSRKTIHGSRPATPATPATEEPEESRSEPVESTTPRRSSKPKLIRYTSLFTNFKDIHESVSPAFAEPWSDVKPEHNSGLYRIFEHYCQLRSTNEVMEAALQQTRDDLATSQARWMGEERRYAEEIRRLELLIAKGTTGVAGFVTMLYIQAHSLIAN